MLKFIDDRLKHPVVFLLSGELGTGKTQFTKGIAKELRISDIIKSPTYTILNEYPFNLARKKGLLVHIDTWRIENLKDLQTIGLERYLKKGNVIVIEWADKFYKDLIPLLKKYNCKVFNVVFKFIDENTRDIRTFKKL
jgi:tRNA threonylcarbamoyladenosine biosynthesis protein TsaE